MTETQDHSRRCHTRPQSPESRDAEGIETSEQLRLLRDELGCDYDRDSFCRGR